MTSQSIQTRPYSICAAYFSAIPIFNLPTRQTQPKQSTACRKRVEGRRSDVPSTFRILVLILFLALLTTAERGWSQSEDEILIGKVLAIGDGDTFYLRTQDGRELWIALWGVECPDIGQKIGQKARRYAEKHILGREIGFTGGASDYYHPDKVYLHRAIERRQGMPLTLCAIYLFVARRLGVPAAIVPLPGHVMLRVYSGDSATLLDPFHRGEVRSERECIEYLAQNGLAPQPGWFRDAEDSAIFLRQSLNLKGSYLRRRRFREARRLDRVVLALRERPVRAAHASRVI